MRVVVTGGAGFLGSDVADLLNERALRGRCPRDHDPCSLDWVHVP